MASKFEQRLADLEARVTHLEGNRNANSHKRKGFDDTITINGVEFWSTSYTAKKMNKSKITIRRYVNAGRLVGQTWGRGFVIRADSVLAYLSSPRQGRKPEPVEGEEV